MAEEKPSLHVDLDWKKQAQEEKRRLEEEQKKRAEAAAASAPTPAAVVAPTGEPSLAPTATATPGARRGRELPQASIQSLAKSLLTQIVVYLQQVTGRSPEDGAAMDVAKHLIDTLGVLEQKTANNLTPEETQFLDTALYDARMRFINVSEQIIAGA
jgi:hypothetical protein